MNQTHAEHLQETFEELYPHLHHFSVVITSNIKRADQLLHTFKKYTTEKKFRVAISVDMLDTGIDVPALLNLVFAKKVLSQAKFRQMIGRGTRRCPDVYGKGKEKSDFLIIDYCLNFDESHQFKTPNTQPIPLQQQYFELQINLLKLREQRHQRSHYETTKKSLLAMVNYLLATEERRANDECIQQYPLIQSVVQGKIFNNIALNPYEQLQKVAPLMKYYDKYTAEELKFLIKNDQYLLASLTNEDTTKRRDKIASDINALSPTISKVQAKS
jgi:type I restriction enzyme R subunit